MKYLANKIASEHFSQSFFDFTLLIIISFLLRIHSSPPLEVCASLGQAEHCHILGLSVDRLCGLVIRFPGYRSRGPGLIPGASKFSEK
jgi:hypothetical protein